MTFHQAKIKRKKSAEKEKERKLKKSKLGRRSPQRNPQQ